MKKKHVPLIVLFVSLICYVGSEIFLRKATATNIDKERYSIDYIVKSLPSSIQDLVSDRIRRGQLEDRIKAAETDEDWINFSTSLAMMASTEDEERESILKEIIQKFPKLPESQNAYLHFFLNDETNYKVTYSDFHQYLGYLKLDQRYFTWKSSIEKLNDKKVGLKEIESFMLPLLEFKPDFKDYQGLYYTLEKAATKNGNKDVASKAKKLKDSCRGLKTIKRFIADQEAKRKKEEQKKRAEEMQKKREQKIKDEQAKKEAEKKNKAQKSK